MGIRGGFVLAFWRRFFWIAAEVVGLALSQARGRLGGLAGYLKKAGGAGTPRGH